MSDEVDSRMEHLLRQAVAGDRTAAGHLFAPHREQLKRLVALRLDRRLARRFDASDVVQETLLEAAQRLGELDDESSMPFVPWLRRLARQKVLEVHRRQLEAGRRDARREVAGGLPTSSFVLAREIAGGMPGPATEAQRREHEATLAEALEAIAPLDREVLLLRHFEQLTHREAAAELEISEAAASQRYVRALRQLEAALRRLGGGPAA